MEGNKSRLCIWSQIRDDSHNLERFIEWHLSQGFEYFVFGDDRSIDDPRSVLKPYIDLGIAEIYDATEHSENHGRFIGKGFFLKSDIVAFIDVDEFVRSVSGFAKNEIESIFSNKNVEILYLNWVLKSIGDLTPSALSDYRDSFPFTLPDENTKYIVRISAVQHLLESELDCHFVSGLASGATRNGSFTKPQFISPNKWGNIREVCKEKEYTINEIPSAWQLPPRDPNIWLDHYYARNFEVYFNFKTILGNKQGGANPNAIRGMAYFDHGVGKTAATTKATFNSLNIRRLYPELKRIDPGISNKPSTDQANKTVYIHMGLPKTGTTAFQKAMYAFSNSNTQSDIKYVQIENSSFKNHAPNGLDLTKSASYQSLYQFEKVITEYSNLIKNSDCDNHLISCEEFSAIESSLFSIIKKRFSEELIHTCGIAVIRPFKEFAYSFFKQYITMHVGMNFHKVLTLQEIAESARLHVERAAIHCMLCDDYKVINYSKRGMSNRLIDFIYQKTLPLDLSKLEQSENLSIGWTVAERLYEIRKGESHDQNLDSKEYFRLHSSIRSSDANLHADHPYHIALVEEEKKLKEFLSSFPHRHRWEHLFENNR